RGSGTATPRSPTPRAARRGRGDTAGAGHDRRTVGVPRGAARPNPPASWSPQPPPMLPLGPRAPPRADVRFDARQPATPTIGAGSARPASDPRNGVVEKSKMPPSDATIR